MLPAHTLERDQDAAPRQPFRYPLQRSFVEPDWTRLPGYREVSVAEWESALWQRRHTVKNLRELKEALGSWLPDDLLTSIERDQRERATMSLLLPADAQHDEREGSVGRPVAPVHAA